MERAPVAFDPERFFGTRPALVAALAFVPAMALAEALFVPEAWSPWPFLASASLLALLGFVLSVGHPHLAHALALAGLSLGAMGLALLQAAPPTPADVVWDTLKPFACVEKNKGSDVAAVDVIADGTIVSAPEFRRGSTRFLFHVTRVRPVPWCKTASDKVKDGASPWIDLAFKVRVSMEGDGDVFRSDGLRAALKIRPLSGPTNFGAPNTKVTLARRGVSFSGTTSRQRMVAVGNAPKWGSLVRRHRARFEEITRQLMGNSSEANLVQILGLGDRRNLDGDEGLEENFRDCGLAHLFSVSGLHVGVVAVSFSWVLRRLFCRFPRLTLRFDVARLACLGAIPLLWLYALLTGGAVPALRAAIMATCVFLARIFAREPDPTSALSMAALILLASDPAAIASVSFQLSFAAVASLMLFTRPIQWALKVPTRLTEAVSFQDTFQDTSNNAQAPPASGLRRFFSARKDECLALFVRLALSARSTLAATLGATLGTMPLVAMTFQQASLVAVVANLVALPLGSVLTALSALSALVLFVSPTLTALILSVAQPLAQLLVALVDNLAAFPLANLPVAAPKLSTVIALYLGAFALLSAWVFPRSKLSKGLFLAALLTFALPKIVAPWMDDEAMRAIHGIPFDDPSLTVIALSVGQGDAFLLKMPDKTHILVDGGGELDGKINPHWRIGKNVVVPSLKSLGVSSLRAVIMTHPHPDHALGLLDVVEAIQVEEIWMPTGVESSELTQHLLKTARQFQGTFPKVRQFHRGMHANVHEADFQFIHPPEPPHDFTGNDESLAFRLTLKTTSFLFTGDMETPAERDVLTWANCKDIESTCPLSAHVLKVGHHGSSTSSSEAFLKAVRPKRAIISCGRGNIFGFPSPKILQRLSNIGATIHRTDTSGALVFTTDGQQIRVWEPFRE